MQAPTMKRVPKKYCHFLFSGIQSGMTCAVAAAIASASFYAEGTFIHHWLNAYLISWAVMLPVALVAAPFIRRLAGMLTV